MLSIVYKNEITILDQHSQQKVKPRLVVDYNVGMKGVDLSDQLAQSYLTTRKSIKWTTKILYKLTDSVGLQEGAHL